MDKETRQAIARLSQKIDGLETTKELIKTSTVLCFTTMDRSADETVSIEFVENGLNSLTNGIIRDARIRMVEHLDGNLRHRAVVRRGCDRRLAFKQEADHALLVH